MNETHFHSINYARFKAFDKNEITISSIKHHLKHGLLVKDSSKPRIKSFRQLASYFRRRENDYLNKVVSPARIRELSFIFKGRFKDKTTDLDCSICLEDYTNGQAVCRLSCGHVCHMRCLRDWFKIELELVLIDELIYTYKRELASESRDDEQSSDEYSVFLRIKM